MRRLKLRNAEGVPPNEPRPRRQLVIRVVYLACVVGLAVWLTDLLFGSYLYLRSEGLVLGTPAVVASENPITVRELDVREGAHVAKGQVVAIASSQAVAESMARLIGEQADRDLRMGDLQIRAQTINAVIGLARTRQTVNSDVRRKLETLLPTGFVALDRHAAAVDSDFRSSEDLEQLQAEQRALTGQIEMLNGAQQEARAALDDLRLQYDGGRLRSPIDGIVGRRDADRGAVLRAGDPLLELYGDERFVLAYVPTGRLFHMRVGEAVSISTGVRDFAGKIVRIEPIAAALPREFQRAFTPVDREQVIRVEFDPDETPPPLFTKVELHAAFAVPHWTGLQYLSRILP
jgi:multidrug resistance efflux pump